ncbi:MAG: DUF72 domain-containing protein [Candidatus Hydrothermota bacterium]|nr:MAG: DUF72 domain-containing protein [Candidatus Hydrothermae bacterium]
MGIKVGICGFAASKSACFRELDVLEVQKTFYKMPRLETLAKWREEAPDDFEFTLKAPQLITHPPSSPTYRRAKLEIPENKRHRYGYFRPTDEVFDAWEKTVEMANALKAQFIVFQTPASFSERPEHIENIRTFFSQIKRYGLILGWEPRGNWNEETVQSICTELDLVHIVDPFKSRTLWGRVAYFRLHGLGKGYRYKFSDEELNWLLSSLPDLKPVYVMFNNTNMFDDAVRFKKLLKTQFE